MTSAAVAEAPRDSTATPRTSSAEKPSKTHTFPRHSHRQPRPARSENQGPRNASQPTQGPIPPDDHPEGKKISRRSSQPILGWLQRKIAGHRPVAGGRKAQQQQDKVPSVPKLPSNLNGDDTTTPRPSDAESIPSTSDASNAPPVPRISSSHRPPSLKIVVAPSSAQDLGLEAANTEDGTSDGIIDSAASARSISIVSASESLRPGSRWSTRGGFEADDDASIRPLPPTSPPSPVPSRSTHASSITSGGYTSDPRTARSIGAPSTKPTTLMSIDLYPGPGGHIAQAPPDSLPPGPPPGPLFVGQTTSNASMNVGGSPISARFPHLRTPTMSSSLSISFSPLPSSSSNRTSLDPLLSAASSPVAPPVVAGKVIAQAPGHTNFHPRNNPRPASPPPDNASTLTLASSTFAMSSYASPRSRSVAPDGSDGGMGSGGGGGGNASGGGGGNNYRDREGGAGNFFDAGASVRALRPSSRRGSWGSDETGWSATGRSMSIISAGGLLSAGVVGSAIGHRRRGPGSITTTWSFRTGGGGGEVDLPDGDVEEMSSDGEREHRVVVTMDGEEEDDEQADEDGVRMDEDNLARGRVDPREIPLPHSPPLRPVV